MEVGRWCENGQSSHFYDLGILDNRVNLHPA